jgi:phosphoesterase RecJ-like protein
MDKAIKIIRESESIYLASHVQPDGDNIGSLLALGMALKKINKDVKILKVDNIPSDYKFLPSVELIKDYEIEKEIDLFIALDSGDIERLGIGKQFAENANFIINIDHHISNTNFGDINIVSPSAAATGEIVYEFIRKMEIDIDKDIATCLYTAISTDTGSFIYSNTSYKTHLIAADLIKAGIDTSDININLYQRKSFERTRLLIDVVKDMEMYFNNKLGMASVTQELLMSNNAKLEDSEGIISFIRDIDSVEVACLLKEIDEKEIKISLRSKKEIDVSKICAKFDGGGHKRAAGCTLYMGIDEAKKLILKEIKMAFR